MPDGEPPSRGWSGLSHRQLVSCVLAAFAAELAAWHLLVPNLQQRVAEGTLVAPRSIESAAIATGGLMLASLGSALLACTLYNRSAPERARRRASVEREIAFLTSLGHCVPGQRPSSDRQSQD